MVWRESNDHVIDRYFCMNDVRGFNMSKKNIWFYPNLESGIRQVFQCETAPDPTFTTFSDIDHEDDLTDDSEVPLPV